MGTIIVMYLLLIPGATLFIYAKHKGIKRISVVIKALCTGTILFTGILGTVGAPEEAKFYAVLISVGIAMGLLGDVAICFKFVIGMLFFALGHLCYIIAMLHATTHALWGIPVFIAVYLLVFMLYRKGNLSFGKLLIPAVVYGIIIISMVSIAATMPFSALPGGAVLLLGAVLFAASDAMLALNTFGKFDQKRDTICLYCYFIGQSFIAVSIYCIG